MRHLCTVLLAIAAGGCLGGDGPDDLPAPVHVAASPIEIERTPEWVLSLCDETPGLKGLCPATIPRRARGGELEILRLSTTPRYPVSYMMLSSGDEWFGRPSKNRPPKFSSVTVMAGELHRVYRRCWPATDAVERTPQDGRLAGQRLQPISFGTQRWGGLEGALSLTPDRGCGTWGQDKLVFRWRGDGAQRAVALQAWEPFTETVPALRYLVESIGRHALAPAHWFEAACTSLDTLRPACPAWIPPARSNFFSMSYHPRGALPGQSAYLSVQWSGEYRRPKRNRPPGFLHVEVSAGHPRPDPGGQVAQPHDGQMHGRSYEDVRPVSFGHVRWGGHHGLLVLGDCFGNHLCFRWRRADEGYQIDLHGWEPFTETVATLRRIVRSTSQP